jgi:hypothetical protein
VNQAIEVLRRLTANVHDMQLPAFEPLPLMDAEAYAYHAAYLAKMPELRQRETRERLEMGAKAAATFALEIRAVLFVVWMARNQMFPVRAPRPPTAGLPVRL